MTCLLAVLGPAIRKKGAHELGNIIRPASVDIPAGPLQRDGYTFLAIPSNCSAGSRSAPFLDPQNQPSDLNGLLQAGRSVAHGSGQLLTRRAPIGSLDISNLD
jgi:hypothetical protein